MSLLRVGPFTLAIQTDKFQFFENRNDVNIANEFHHIKLIADSSLSLGTVLYTVNRCYSYSPQSVYTALQKVLATEGVENKLSLTMHTAGLSGKKGGVLLFGESGAGKSTLADKLSDYFFTGNSDNNIIFFPHGNEKEFSFTSLPFYNAQKSVPIPMKEPAPIRIAFLLKKEFDSPSSITKIEDKDRIWRFLIKGQVQAPMLQPELFPQYNEMVSEFVEKIDFFLLKHNLHDTPEFLHNLISGVMND